MRRTLAGMRRLGVVVGLLVSCGGGPPPPAKMSSTLAAQDTFAPCPSEATVVGGGYEIAPEARVAGKLPLVVASRPTENGWRVECVDSEGKPTAGCKAFVVCATVLR